ncbi:nucleotide-diphospho-sugar transferase [Aspergillus campestris IBT 28561]|uniref:Nucleotide-diphospho-sugar transferase n=1 Tax=Aspergillus campestris (strain IBT 28561) TaxID=1392248 RepID=A0A2I1D9Q8_ASPC2|nr:nucleotide-diphospho-sugar transferase [Aspergillus campestris IBT 28561]PKY06609.1 nucleotide-diphospho-sugar transferase [Aspergillus campestris IBT 28561]
MLAPRRFNWISPLSDRRARLWQSLHFLLEQHAPDGAQPTLRGSVGLPRFNAINEVARENHIANADEIRLPLQAAHDGFVQDIRDLNVDRAYVPGTVGIVSSAGGSYLPTFIVSLHLLRQTGSDLPVELFMKDSSEYEPHICEVILPPLGVKCVVLSEILTGQDDAHPIEGFQLKAFAMLFSSFEKFLWLDADCVPIHNPAPILSSEPFISTGLVTWPDFWANTAAPVYFDISRQPAPPSTARQATEAGVLLLSKTTHFHTLLLAVYYNYYGPDYYYPLLSQGAPGAGDKDTFLHAATALNSTFYSVSEAVVDLGNVTPWNPSTAVNAGYIQADPIQDYNLTSQGKWRTQDPTVSHPPRALFSLLGEKLHGFDGKHTRLWTHPPEAMERIGYDAERKFWEVTLEVTCSMESVFETWKSKTGLCDDVRAHWTAVFEDPDKEAPRFTDDGSR